MTDDTSEDDRIDGEPSDATEGGLLPHASEVYKVLGELAAQDGVGVLGHNTATSGAAVGVEGVTDSPDGYGLYTPDDARIGAAELTALSGTLTGDTEVTDLLGDAIAVDGTGALTWTGTYETYTFPTSGTTWNAVTGLSGATPVELTVDARDLTVGRVRVEVDGALEKLVDTRARYHTVVEPTSSLAVGSEQYYSFVASFDVSAQETGHAGIAFKDDGTRMFTIGKGNENAYAYDLSTAWDVTSAGYTGNAYDLSGQTTSPESIRFRPDGTKMFVLGIDTVYSYDLSTAWDVTSATINNSIYLSGSPESIAFEDDGTQLFVLDSSESVVHSFTLGTAWDVTTATDSGDSYQVPSQGLFASPRGVAFNGDGTEMYVPIRTNNANYLCSHALSTAWDVTSASLIDYFRPEALGGIAARGDGTSLYVADNDVVYQYDEGYSGTARASVQK